MTRGIGRIIGAILMGGLLVGEAGAHTKALPTVTCSGLPEDGFFTRSPAAEITLTAGAVGSPATPKQGTDLTNEGKSTHYYAKITVPWLLAAGELRVFDTGAGPSDAVLCQGGSQRAISRTTYTQHDQSSVVKRVTAASMKVAEAELLGDGATETEAKKNYDAVRAALNGAATQLRAAATALRRAGSAAQTDDAKTKAGTDAREAEEEAQTATTAYNNPTLKYQTPNYDDGATAEERATARKEAYDAARARYDTALAAAEAALDAAAEDLGGVASGDHRGFQIRADVQPNDRSYILVTNAAPTLGVTFHGAHGPTSGRLSDTLDPGTPNDIAITVTAPGLLTIEATGSTDTRGFVNNSATPPAEIARADGGGSGTNFKMYVPVTTGAHTLYVAGQTDTLSGSYGLTMDFAVAPMGATAVAADGVTPGTAVDWGADLGLPDDRASALQTNSDTDYFVFTMGGTGLLTVQASDGDGATQADTEGTLYGPPGIEIMSDSSGNGTHFRVQATARSDSIFAVRVSGRAGSYQVTPALKPVSGTTDLAVLDLIDAPSTPPDCSDVTTPTPHYICMVAETASFDIDRYLIDVKETGALYIQSTSDTDTYGTLLGPSGAVVGQADSGGDQKNFRLAVQVTPGLYLLEVRGKTKKVQGPYGLRTRFETGAAVDDPTDPGDDTGGGGASAAEVRRLRTQVATLQRELDECRDPVETDETGFLENPPDGGFRSGIGLISGWVCAAEAVTVEILRGGVVRETFTVAQGTSRRDTVGQCDHDSENTGFGMTYNFNHLPEGPHTIRALADDDLIGSEHTFEVVHIMEFEPDDADRFPTGLRAAECRVEDFPATGVDTYLLWEQSTQNFVIDDAG